VTVLVSNHNCIGNPPVERSLASRVEWLQGALLGIMKVDATTTTSSIIDAIALHYGYRIQTRQAQRVRNAILSATHKELVADYSKIPAYLQALHKVSYHMSLINTLILY
jgi:hypothetical protein